MKVATREEIKETIHNTLRLLIDTENMKISDDDFLTEDLGASSVAIVQLFLTCQETFDLSLADDINLAEPITINQLTDKILNQMAQ